MKGKLNKKQLEVIELLVLFPDRFDKEICEMAGITPQALCNYKKKPEFNEVLEARIKKKFNSLQAKAVKTLEKAMDSDSKDAVKAATYVLSSAGYEAPKDININSGDINIKIGND